MCDVFICSDSGVGLCEDDRRLLEGLGMARGGEVEEEVEEEVNDANNNVKMEEDRNGAKDSMEKPSGCAGKIQNVEEEQI